MSQNGHRQFKNLAAIIARFLKCVWSFWDVQDQNVNIACRVLYDIYIFCKLFHEPLTECRVIFFWNLTFRLESLEKLRDTVKIPENKCCLRKFEFSYMYLFLWSFIEIFRAILKLSLVIWFGLLVCCISCKVICQVVFSPID